MKKTLSVILIISCFLSVIPLALAEESFCGSARDAALINDCDSLVLINGSNVKNNCSENVFQDYSTALINCQNNVEKEKQELELKINNIEEQESSTEWYLSKLKLDIKYLNYEITNLDLSIKQLEEEIEKRGKAIKELDVALSGQKEVLKRAIIQVYEYDTTSYIEVLLGNSSLSEFNEKLEEIDTLQTELRLAIKDIQEARNKMEEEKIKMEEDIEEKSEYKKVQQYSAYSLANKKDQQNYFLSQLAEAKTPLEKEMARIESELLELKNAMGKIQRYLSLWLMGEQPTWSQIFSAVQNASSATGVRKALILGILQVESGFATNLGQPGRYKEACDWGWTGCNNLDVFLQLCDKYGYDPNKVPTSSACAIGPTQFVPCTWRGYMGLANPWNLKDAVMATAKLLKNNGATSGNERSAVYAYNHSYNYVDLVLTSASAWQNVIDVCGLNLSCPQMKKILEDKFGGIPIE